MKNRFIIGSILLLISSMMAFGTSIIANSGVVYFWDDDIEQNVCLSEDLAISCLPGMGECFEETSVGFRYLYGRKDCTMRLSEEVGFHK